MAIPGITSCPLLYIVPAYIVPPTPNPPTTVNAPVVVLTEFEVLIILAFCVYTIPQGTSKLPKSYAPEIAGIILPVLFQLEFPSNNNLTKGLLIGPTVIPLSMERKLGPALVDNATTLRPISATELDTIVYVPSTVKFP